MSSTDSGQTLKKNKRNNLRNRGNGCPPLPCSTFGQRKGQIQTGLVLTVDQGRGRQWRQLEKNGEPEQLPPQTNPSLTYTMWSNCHQKPGVSLNISAYD